MTWLIGSRRYVFRKRTSFTLLEALIVVTVIGALLVVSVPRFRGTFESLRFQNFCQNLVSRMRYLQERASVNQNIYRLHFNLPSKRIEISFKDNFEDDTFLKIQSRFGNDMVIPEKIEIETDPLTILFLPDGSIAGDDISVRDNHRSVTITIISSLGRITLEDNDEENE